MENFFCAADKLFIFNELRDPLTWAVEKFYCCVADTSAWAVQMKIAEVGFSTRENGNSKGFTLVREDVPKQETKGYALQNGKLYQITRNNASQITGEEFFNLLFNYFDQNGGRTDGN